MIFSDFSIQIKFYKFALVNLFVRISFRGFSFQIIPRKIHLITSPHYSEENSGIVSQNCYSHFLSKNWFRFVNFCCNHFSEFLIQINFYRFALVNLFVFFFKCCFVDFFSKVFFCRFCTQIFFHRFSSSYCGFVDSF